MAKKKVTFYVEETVIENFKKNVNERAINQSRWVELKLIEFNHQCELEKSK